MKKVFVDTMIFHHASSVVIKTHADQSDGHITKANTGNRIPKRFVSISTEIKPPNINEKLSHNVSIIADLAKAREITLNYSHEVNLELLCQPLVDIAVGRFQGAPCSMVHSPLLKVSKEEFTLRDETENPLSIYPIRKYDSKYFEAGGEIDSSEIEEFVRDQLLSIPIDSSMYMLDFRAMIAIIRETVGYSANTPILMFSLLKTVNSVRYKEILSMLNIDNIRIRNQPNSYMDALHLWSAEKAGCNIFLTCDSRIKSQYENDTLVVMEPEDLLSEMNQ